MLVHVARRAGESLGMQLGIVDHRLGLHVSTGSGGRVRMLRVMMTDLRRRVASVRVRGGGGIGIIVICPRRRQTGVTTLLDGRPCAPRRLIPVAGGERVDELVGAHPGVVI